MNAQEKRLALVIGNANYDKGTLKNPVNDAFLMKETLMNLGFDVILDTNLRTRNDLLKSINSFGERRKNYHVGFVYYAGHGVQIDGINYILPTKEKYESKIDVEDNGVNVDRFIKYFEMIKNEVNILVLDACRNNPYEKNWAGSSRSLVDGLGLAPIPNSTGNIIAFSTSAGTTASDGKENAKNSSYCLSLVKNMMTVDLDLDQIFRNVRKEIREISGDKQQPTVDNQYEGSDFYFKKSTYTDQIIQIDSLIDEESFDLALEKVAFILTKSPDNKKALLRRGRIEYTRNLEYNGLHLFKADSLFPNDAEVLEYLGRYYSTIGEVEKANEIIDRAISLYPKDPNLVYWKGVWCWESENLSAAEKFFTKAIILDSTEQRFTDRAIFYENYPEFYSKAQKDYDRILELSTNKAQSHFLRGNFFKDILKEPKKALKEYNQAIIFDQDNVEYLYARGLLYSENLENPIDAIEDWKSILKIDTSDVDAFNVIGLEYINLGDTLTGLEWLENGIQLESINPNSSAFCYANRADIYSKQGKFEEAYNDYTKAIFYSTNKSEYYFKRSEFNLNFKEDEISAMNDLNEAIRLDPFNIGYLYNRGVMWVDYLKNDSKAIEDWNKALDLDPSFTDAINAIGTIYKSNGDTLKAIDQFSKGIIHENQNPDAAAFCYGNRADLYAETGKLVEAESDYSTAINLSSSKPMRYYYRALFYYYGKNDLIACIKDLDMAIKLDPTNIEYLHDRGIILGELEKYDKAILDFETILSLVPNNIDAINQIGVLYEEQGKIDDAIKFYSEGIEKSNLDQEATSFCYSNRGRLFYDQNLFEKALSDFNKSIELSQGESRFYEQRSNYFKERGENDKALIDLSLAIENTTTEKSYYFYRRAELYKEYFKNQDNAYEDYKKSIELDSTNRDALIGICEYKKSQGEINQAIKILDDWHSNIGISDSIRTDYLVLKGMYNSAEGEIDEANKCYNKAIEIDSKNAIIFYQRGMFYEYYLNDLENAIKDYSMAIELEPENTEYYLRRSDVFFKLGNFKSQNKDILKVRKIDSKSIDFIGKEALVYASQGDLKKAIELSNEAISVSPENYMAYLYKAKVLIKNKDFSGSEEILKKVMEMEPNDPEAFFLMGKIFENKGENFNAAYMFGITENKFTKGNFFISDDLGNTVEKSEVYYEIGLFYEKMKAYDLMRKMFSISINLISQNQLYRLNEIKIEIQEKLKNCQN